MTTTEFEKRFARCRALRRGGFESYARNQLLVLEAQWRRENDTDCPYHLIERDLESTTKTLGRNLCRFYSPGRRMDEIVDCVEFRGMKDDAAQDMVDNIQLYIIEAENVDAALRFYNRRTPPVISPYADQLAAIVDGFRSDVEDIKRGRK